MAALQPHMASLSELGAQILACCHPNALRYVRGDLQDLESRWRQLEQRSNSRAAKLTAAVNAIRGNAAALEQLLAWVTETHALLQEKERSPLSGELREMEREELEHRVSAVLLTLRFISSTMIAEIYSTGWAPYYSLSVL